MIPETIIQQPLEGHQLTQGDCDDIVFEAAAALDTSHTRISGHSYRRDISVEVLEALISVAQDYAGYRLGYGNIDRDTVVGSLAILESLTPGEQVARGLAREAVSEIDSRIAERLGAAPVLGGSPR